MTPKAPAAEPALLRALHEAARHQQAGDLAKAEAMYRQILKRHPDHPDALHLLGMVTHLMGDNRTAVDLIRRVIKRYPDFPEAHNTLGNILKSQGDTAGALACYRRALELKPGHVSAHYNLGNCYRDAGDLEQASTCYRRAVEISPEDAKAHNAHGGVLHDQGRLDEAEASYRRAIELKPDYVEAHNNLGGLLHVTERIEPAIVCYQRALSIDPRHVDALRNLGRAAMDTGDHTGAVTCLQAVIDIGSGGSDDHCGLGEALRYLGRQMEAAAACRRALALEPEHLGALNALGKALRDQGRLDEAEATYRRALEVDPSAAEFHNNIGNLLQSKGQYEEADAEFAKALELKPDHPAALRNIASGKKVASGDSILPRIAKALDNPTLSDRDKSRLSFALGKCFDDLGDYDKAFAQYRIANEIRKRLRPFDYEEFERLVTRLCETFDRSFFSTRAEFGSESRCPIFIVGMPRSGTTLVEQILSSHPRIFGAGELSIISNIANDLPGSLGGDYPECAAQLSKDLSHNLAERYLGELRERGGSAERITDKMPQNFVPLGLIALLFPASQIIHCRRDALDVCLSCYFQDFRNQPFSHDLKGIGHYFRAYERLMAHWTETLPMRIFEARYEELVADTEAVSRRMIDFCGLEWDAACIDFHDSGRPILTASRWQVRQPVYKTSIGRWRRYEKHLGPLKRALEAAA